MASLHFSYNSVFVPRDTLFMRKSCAAFFVSISAAKEEAENYNAALDCDTILAYITIRDYLCIFNLKQAMQVIKNGHV